MLAKEMSIQQRWLHYLYPWINLQRLTGPSCGEFQPTRVNLVQGRGPQLGAMLQFIKISPAHGGLNNPLLF
jgi:hypothetical protein